jgi:Sister chromatid cohesion protein Dcc1
VFVRAGRTPRMTETESQSRVELLFTDEVSSRRKIALFQVPTELLGLIEDEPRGGTLPVLTLKGSLSRPDSASQTNKRTASEARRKQQEAVLCSRGATWSLRALASTDTFMAAPQASDVLLQVDPPVPPRSQEVQIVPAIQYEVTRVRPLLRRAVHSLFEGDAARQKGVSWGELRRQLAASDAEIVEALHDEHAFCVDGVSLAGVMATPSTQFETEAQGVQEEPGRRGVAVLSAEDRFRRLPEDVVDEALDVVLQTVAMQEWMLNSISEREMVSTLHASGLTSLSGDSAVSGQPASTFDSALAVAHALRMVATERADGSLADPRFERFRGLDGDLLFSLSPQKVCAFRARRILCRADSEDAAERQAGGFAAPGIPIEMELDEFVERWKQRVPPGIEPSVARDLLGVAVVFNRFKTVGMPMTGPPGVRLIDSQSLPDSSVRERIVSLLQLHNCWTAEDVEPFVEKFLDDGETVEDVLLKVARTDTLKLLPNHGDALGIHENSVRVFVPRS